jgi:hypothetical protein
MGKFRILIASGLLALATTVGTAALWLDVRETVDRTQSDLRRAQEYERQHGKEVARYDNAAKHLSDFDRDFTRGHFDRGKLDTAIDDVKNVVDHNTLAPGDRDALVSDLRDLRVMRAERR